MKGDAVVGADLPGRGRGALLQESELSTSRASLPRCPEVCMPHFLLFYLNHVYTDMDTDGKSNVYHADGYAVLPFQIRNG